MAVLPDSRNELILFCETHLLPWASNQANIGISVQNVTDVTTATTNARADFSAAIAARDASVAGTLDYHTSTDSLRVFAADIVKRIRLHAEATNDPTVYSLAKIPAPLPASPLPPPATPTNFTGQLNSDGHVELTWKGDIEGRMFFTVMRQVTPVGAIPGGWELRGSVPDNFLLDTDVPPGASSVAYRIAARRGPHQSVFTDPVSVFLATPGAAAA